MRFPTDGPDWELSEEQLATFCETYPTLNVVRECQKASLWLMVNPSRRKTAKGMPRFLVNWLNRAEGLQPKARVQAPVNRPPAMTYEWNCPHTPPCGNRVSCGIVAQRKHV